MSRAVDPDSLGHGGDKCRLAVKRGGLRGRRVLVHIHDRLRVSHDGKQFILEVRKGRETERSTGWRGRSYNASRTALIRAVRQRCPEIPEGALRELEALPERAEDVEATT